MKSILFIHHGQSRGGALIALLALINELKANYNIQVLSIFNSEAVNILKNEGVLVTLPKSRFYSRYYQLFSHSDAIDRINKIRNYWRPIYYLCNKYLFAKSELNNIKSNFDLVYLNSAFISDWAYASKKLNKKVIIHVREPVSKGLLGIRKQMIKRNILRYCDNIISITRDNAKRLDIENKNVIYDPVVINNRGKIGTGKKSNKYKYFIYLGGMLKIKGFEQLMASLEHLNDDIRIYFLGPNVNYTKNKFKKNIKSMIDNTFKEHEGNLNKMNYSKHIINVGFTDDIFHYLNNSIALIVPFLKPHAALPILEAFSVGRPVIASDIKGMDEIINSSNGLVFENKNARSLADKINEMSLISQKQQADYEYNCLNTYHKIRKNEKEVLAIVEETFISKSNLIPID